MMQQNTQTASFTSSIKRTFEKSKDYHRYCDRSVDTVLSVKGKWEKNQSPPLKQRQG
jgi:hypothetical protein